MSDYRPTPLDYPIRDELARYSRDVLSGKIIACQKHKWACERFLRDLEREGTDEFPYLFVEEKANRFLNWMRLFKHRKGVLAGQRIEPHIIQKFIFGNVYGWVHMRTGYRRFKKLYWQVGRKNAKSQSLAAVGSYEAAAMNAGAAEVYCAATKTEQARIVWDEIDAMIKGCPELRDRFRTAYHRIQHLKSGSIIRTLSREDRKEGDGLNPQCGIVDEYHAHDTSEFYDILSSGMGARPEPLLAIITTAGFDLNAPCYRVEYQYVSQILDPNSPIENDEYFVMINELDVDEDGTLADDITNERVWEKANPILCSYEEGRAYIRGELRMALDAPEKMRNFLTKHMNIWVQMREGGYMRMDKWAACEGEIPDLRGAECYVGVDLSAKHDLTSVAFVFPRPDGRYVVLSHSFMPAETVAAKRQQDRVPYDLWVQQGWITQTSGAVVDYDSVRRYIKERTAEGGWEIREVCVDPWNASQFATDMMNDGFTVVEVPQTIRNLSGPTKHFRELVLQGKVIHDGNPVLTWAMGNAVTRQDANENIMLDKSKARERIDPVTATITAHARAMHAEPEVDLSQYTTDEYLDMLGW